MVLADARWYLLPGMYPRWNPKDWQVHFPPLEAERLGFLWGSLVLPRAHWCSLVHPGDPWCFMVLLGASFNACI